MLKKQPIGVVAIVVVLTGAFAAVAEGTAGLKWTEEGAQIASGTSPTVTTSGKLKFSNATLGGTECPIKGEITLKGATSTAEVNELAVTKLGECVFNGAIATSCLSIVSDQVTGTEGKTLVSSNGGAWAATGKVGAGVASLEVTSPIVIHKAYEPKATESGKFCAKKLRLESTATAKPTVTFDAAAAVTKATFAGSLTAKNAETGSHLGNVNITGSMTIQAPNHGRFGIT
jgi:hypothetical protein